MEVLESKMDEWVRNLEVMTLGFPGGSMVKESTCQCRRRRFNPGSGRSPGGGHGNPLQYSCLENPMDLGAWWKTVRGVTKSQTQLSDWTELNVNNNQTSLTLQKYVIPDLFLNTWEKVKMLVAQSCPTLCDPITYSLPGSSVHGILQARILERVAIPFSRGFSWPRDRMHFSYIAGGFFTVWATREDKHMCIHKWMRYE